jgi:hypothetical protein
MILSLHNNSMKGSLLRQPAMSMWSWSPVFHRLSPSSSSVFDVMCAVFTHCIYASSCHLSQPRLHGEWWVESDSQEPIRIDVDSCWSSLQCFSISLICYIMFTAWYPYLIILTEISDCS